MSPAPAWRGAGRLLRTLALALALADCRARPAGAADAGAVEGPTAEWREGRMPASAFEGTPVRGGAFRVRVPVEPAGLTRVHDGMAEAMMVRYTVGPVYETLAELDRATHPRYTLKPLLAESWAESEDHRSLTVTLRKGVRFHDGTALSAADVKATVDAVLAPENPTSSFRSTLAGLVKAEVTGPLTLRFTWDTAYFLAARSLLAGLPILPAHALVGDFDTLKVHRAPIGTGPFRFESWETGKALTFKRAPGYWGPAPYLETVVIRFVRDETVAAQLFEKGEFELMTRIPPSVWVGLEAPSAQNAWAFRGYHRIRFAENTYSFLGWNQERPFFADVRVRRALALLYPAELINKTIDLGLEWPTTCPFYRGSDSCDPAVVPLARDVKAAQALLEEAGWVDTNDDGVRDRGGQPLQFTFLSNPASVKLSKLAPLLQEELRKAGIDMQIEKVDSALYLQRLRAHDFDACSLAWAQSDVVQDQFQVFHSSQVKSGSNYVSYKNAEADQLIEAIRTEFDPARRTQLERRLHRRLYDDQVYLFTSNRPALDAAKVSVHGLAPSLAWYDLRAVWLSP